MYKDHYSRFLFGHGKTLHFTAHSHHFWPDVSWNAHISAWNDAAGDSDYKWKRVFEEILPNTQENISQILGVNSPEDIVFGSNTHELVFRLISSFDFFTKKFIILTTDGEFHSFSRQVSRLEELPFVKVVRVPVFPFSSFEKRFLECAEKVRPNFTYFSHVFFRTGFVVENLSELSKSLKRYSNTVAIDGYHGFCAIPTSLSSVKNDVFYVAGGYKYAQSGEGCAFMYVPPKCELRPLYTGWFADENPLDDTGALPVRYGSNAKRFMGSTFDPTGIYRMNAVMEWMNRNNITVPVIHEYVSSLQENFLENIKKRELKLFNIQNLVTALNQPRAHFLSFRIPEAKRAEQELAALEVAADSRGEYLRIGFGLYHDTTDIERLIDILTAFEYRRKQSHAISA